MTKNYRILLLSFLLAMPLFILAQRPGVQTIFLKNGSVIKGFIVEEVPNKSYKVQTADQSTFVFSIEDVEKIVWETPPSRPPFFRNRQADPQPLGEVSPYNLNFDLIFGTPINQNDNYYLDNFSGLNASLTYKLKRNFSAGIGVGLENYDGINWIPVFLELRSEVKHGLTSPYVYGRIGYSTPSDHYNYRNYTGGLIVGVGFGVNTELSANTSLGISLGYRYQNFKYDEQIYYYDYRIETGVTGGDDPNGTNPEPPVIDPNPWIMPPYWYPPYQVNTGVHFLTLSIGLSF
ncbi:MAG: hypothetical protein Q7J34_05380 [Bacteroidales bacterium]|nr:hypothetical protein [Bacteroidales bacterium]